MLSRGSRMPLVRAGVVIGLGIGGFFDGIVFHQILQWHHMVSEQYPPVTLENLEINTLADGLFHIVAYAFTIIGLFMLWQVRKQFRNGRSTRTLIGAVLIGWGIFNLVEGIINHHLLQIHHVRPGPDQAVWDVAFLVWGALMVFFGWFLARTPYDEPEVAEAVAANRETER